MFQKQLILWVIFFLTEKNIGSAGSAGSARSANRSLVTPLRTYIKNIVLCHLCIVFFIVQKKLPGCRSFYFDSKQTAELNSIKLASDILYRGSYLLH